MMRESHLLTHVFASNAVLPHNVVIPPGDDMGGVKLWGGVLLAGVDQLVDGLHVRLDITPVELIGRKAVTRCLSDLAAMAAFPLATVAAATLPIDFGEDRANALFDAMRATCEQYRCPLIGGDIAVHRGSGHPLVIATTCFGGPLGRQAALRSGARAGDAVYVTGPLGGSLGADGLGRHLTFEPRLDLAREIRMTLGDDGLHAMIDISDGLGRDASHIAEMSNVQIVLEAECIPCQPGCSWMNALCDGEDYELLFCARSNLQQKIAGTIMHRIGTVVPRSSSNQPYVLIQHGGQTTEVGDLGWEHSSGFDKAARP